MCTLQYVCDTSISVVARYLFALAWRRRIQSGESCSRPNLLLPSSPTSLSPVAIRLLLRSRRRPRAVNPIGAAALSALAALYVAGCASTPEAERDVQAQEASTAAAGGSGTATVPAQSDVPVAATLPAVEGRRVADVQAAFAARQASLRGLNSSRASQNAGKIVVSFVVAPTGQVVECRLVSSDFQDPAFNTAVFAEVWRLYLGERNVGEWAVNDYPIEFAARETALPPATNAPSAPILPTNRAPVPAAPASPNAVPAG